MSLVKGTIIVTGANGGLGSAVVEQIASSAELSLYHGLYTVRDAASAPVLTSALQRGGSSHPRNILSLDLTKLDQVRQVAEGINTRISAGQIPPIRALVLNAGGQDFGNQSWTEDGLDVTFAANYLGHWLFTLLLLKSMDKNVGRIIIVGSHAHDPNDKKNNITGAFNEEKWKTFVEDESQFEAIAKGTWSSAKDYPNFPGGYRRYGASKLFLIMFMHELQSRLNKESELKNISVLGVDPGMMITGMQRSAPWVIRVLMFQYIYPLILYLFPKGPVRSTSRSASDILAAAFGSDSGEFPKDLYFCGRELFETSAESRDVRKRSLVWAETVKLTHLKKGETILGDGEA